MLTNSFGPDIGLLLATALGYIIGLAYGLATDKMLEKPAGKWSVAVGTLSALACGLLLHWAVGMVVGSVLGSLTGALIERRVMKDRWTPPAWNPRASPSSPRWPPRVRAWARCPTPWRRCGPSRRKRQRSTRTSLRSQGRPPLAS
ncbi:unnamed protein product [Effrenium voratum]|nr:unnamed protein product [Effrenium voratum]